MRFFLGADHDLDTARFLRELASPEGLDGPMIDACGMLSAEREECQAGINEGIAAGQAALSVFELECASDIMDAEEAEEALCLAIFEGGSLNPDLRIIGLS